MSKHINKIFSMIQTELKSEKVELEKVELARKPQSIFSDAKKLDNKLDSIEKKMDKAYLNYRSAYDQFISASADIDSRASKLDDDLSDVEDSAKERILSMSLISHPRRAFQTRRKCCKPIRRQRRL